MHFVCVWAYEIQKAITCNEVWQADTVLFQKWYQAKVDGKQTLTNLTPDQHGSKDDLQAVKEVVPDDDDCSTPCGPAFTRADGFDTRGSCKIHRQNRLTNLMTPLHEGLSSWHHVTDPSSSSHPSLSRTHHLLSSLPEVGGKWGILIRVIICTSLLNITLALRVRAAAVRLFYDTWQSVRACKCQVCWVSDQRPRDRGAEQSQQ